jgi:glucosyl-dolichyl phosphate glucuronosyltransferase
MSQENLIFSVIICAHTLKRWDDLIEAVASVENQDTPAHQIIVVIDHNPEMFTKARSQFDRAVVVENHNAHGLNGARNSGVDAATGNIIAFLDDDAVAAPDWISQLQAAYSHEGVVGAGGKINPQWLSGRPRWFPDEFLWVVGCTYKGMPTTPAPVRNLIGCNMSYRRDIVLKVGGFLSGIGHVGGRPQGDDETELCIRIHQKLPGSVLIYTPEAQVSHKVPADRTRPGYYRWRCYLEGRSKALLSRLLGASDGLSSERTYTLRTLPVGFLRGIGDTLFKFDPYGVLRASAIFLGLFITTFGYLQGMVLNKIRPPVIEPQHHATNQP